MSYSLSYLIWPLLSLLLGGLQITAAVFLLRERGWGPWLMLIGSGIAVGGSVAFRIMVLVMTSSNKVQVYTAVSSLTTLGSLLFGIGLLLHALQRRAQGNRIAELEAILAATHGE